MRCTATPGLARRPAPRASGPAAAIPELSLPARPLSDGVVLLRPAREADVPDVVAACQDPEIPRWTTVPAPYGDSDARAWMAGHEAMRREGRGACFAIADAAQDRLIGAVDLVVTSWPHACGEIGYWLAREVRGQGLAVRAVRLLSGWAFSALGLVRLEILAEPENGPSQAVAERAGFEREGVLRSYRELKGTRRDYVLFSLLAGEGVAEASAGWRARAG